MTENRGGICEVMKDERGAVVVEATISLTTFMFVIVTLLTITNMCLAQVKIGVALAEAAEDLSKLSYVYEMTGLAGAREGMAANGQSADESLKELQSSIENLDFGGVAGIATQFAEDGDLQSSLFSLIGTKAVNGVTDGVMRVVCNELVKIHLTDGQTSCGDYLKRLGVKGAGGNETGLRFTKCSFCTPDGANSDLIIIHVRYTVHVIELLGMDIEYPMEQCVVTKAWKAAK